MNSPILLMKKRCIQESGQAFLQLFERGDWFRVYHMCSEWREQQIKFLLPFHVSIARYDVKLGCREKEQNSV